ncbi:hypothetical protein QT711_13185 [Sporosarcina saromensis]|uniref:Uncharacterized protein n=1 Tax=Sporosarcina saromensis TaxID=359365 RepID=A0ABU4GAZ1_9BACL|nr:hypothetical protein [Sporosarcina saromensis]MDW0114144.1 hypothetical protein [Sporosarcina saromensis]
MGTKSRSSRLPLVMSIFAIGIATISIGYCFPHLLNIAADGWERSTEIVSYFARIIKGGTA